jgi:hypothetical protein
MKLSYEADAAIHDHSTSSAMKKHSRRVSTALQVSPLLGSGINMHIQ